jgi:hypothetical protein
MAAQLMIELAPDVEHSANVKGSLILKRAEVLRDRLEQLRSHEGNQKNVATPIEGSVQAADVTRQEFTPGGLDFDLDDDGVSAMEPFWDFRILRARPW